jgi:hypothetical protein
MSEAFSVRVGMKVKHNDPRMSHRGLYEIASITDGRATLLRNSGDWFTIALKRIHADDKPRRTGWSVVRDASQKTA